MPTPISFQLYQGSNQSALPGEVYDNPVIFRAYGSDGQPLPNEPVVFSLPQSGPSGTFTASGTAAPFYTTSDTQGYCTSGYLRAGSTVGVWSGAIQFVNALSIAASFNLTNEQYVSVPASQSIFSGTNQKAGFNAPYAQIGVAVKDQTNSPSVGTTVQFSVPAGHGTFPGGVTTITAVTNSQGNVYSPVFTANNVAGPFTVTVSIPDTPAVPQVTTTFTNIDPAVPTTLQYVSGTNQQTAVSTPFTNPLKVRVLNGLAAPVASVTVTFTSPSAGASCSFPALLSVGASISGADGIATSGIPLANPIAGTYAVAATATGATGAQFTLTNGIGYQPEFCTPSTSPVTGTNQGTGLAWANPASVIHPTNSASVSVDPDDTGSVSMILLASPLPAALQAAIDDNARITKFIFTWDLRCTRTGSYTATSRNGLYNGATARSSLTNESTIENTWQSKTRTITSFTGGSTISGSQFKTGNFGLGITVAGGNGTGGQVQVRNAKMVVCYQNPSGAGQVTTSLALLACET